MNSNHINKLNLTCSQQFDGLPPMVALDNAEKHFEIEIFDDKIELYFLNRNTDDFYEMEFTFDDKLKTLIKATQ